MRLQIRPFVSPAFAENGYLVHAEGARECVVIDPGSAVNEALQVVEREGLEVAAVLLTHAHIDHVEGVAEVVRATGAPIYLHPADTALYQHAPQQALMFGMRMDAPPPVNCDLAHGQQLDIGGVTYEVRHAPGHAPGHVMFVVADAGCAFVGDVIFLGSIGRTDLPGGDFRQLIESIRAQVFTLPDETVLYNGHGPETSVGHERATNPFLIPQYGGGLA